MPVTDQQAAPLRALLARQPDEHDRLFGLLDLNAKRTGYQALVSAAFVVAVQRRFTRDTSQAEVIEVVGGMRARSPRLAGQVDPVVAERLVMAVFNDDPLDDLDARKSFEVQSVLMVTIIYDENLDEAGLDDFLAKARKLADEWLELGRRHWMLRHPCELRWLRTARMDSPTCEQLPNPSAVNYLLRFLQKAGQEEQAAALAARAAQSIPLDDPGGVADLLRALREPAENEQPARDPAASLLLDDSYAVKNLLRALRERSENEQATALTARLPAEGQFDLFREEASNGEPYRFGCEPSGLPAPAWGWDDLDD